MPIRDILFPMLSYPVATATDSIERAVRFAAGLGAHFGRDIRAGHPFADQALHASARDRRHPRGRTAESAVNARDLAATFDAVCAQGGARYEHSVEHCTWADIPKVLTDQARLRDLCIFPVITTDRATYLLSRRSSSSPGDRCYCCPKARRGIHTRGRCRRLHSRSATRAVANALPILQAAKHVYVITVVDENFAQTRHRRGAVQAPGTAWRRGDIRPDSGQEPVHRRCSRGACHRAQHRPCW
jgi:hypothetical protein